LAEVDISTHFGGSLRVSKFQTSLLSGNSLYRGEGDGTACAVINQLLARLSYNFKYFVVGPTANFAIG
jgi:hypothetical protein